MGDISGKSWYAICPKCKKKYNAANYPCPLCGKKIMYCFVIRGEARMKCFECTWGDEINYIVCSCGEVIRGDDFTDPTF